MRISKKITTVRVYRVMVVSVLRGHRRRPSRVWLVDHHVQNAQIGHRIGHFVRDRHQSDMRRGGGTDVTRAVAPDRGILTPLSGCAAPLSDRSRKQKAGPDRAHTIRARLAAS